MESFLRRAGREPNDVGTHLATGGLATDRLLLCLLAHSPKGQAAALAASLAKAARAELRAPSCDSPAVAPLLTGGLVMHLGVAEQPSPALRQLAGLIAGVLCDMGSALRCGVSVRCNDVRLACACIHVTAQLASLGTDAARRAWRAQLLSLQPWRLLGTCFEGGSPGVASAACAVAAAAPEELRAAALQAERPRGVRASAAREVVS
jgi:hypothetical protein